MLCFYIEETILTQISASHQYITAQCFDLTMCVNLHNSINGWKNDFKYGINIWCSDTLHCRGNTHRISQILSSIIHVYISLNARTAFGSTSWMLVYDTKYRTILSIWFSVEWSLMQLLTRGHSSILIQVINLFHGLSNLIFHWVILKQYNRNKFINQHRTL